MFKFIKDYFFSIFLFTLSVALSFIPLNTYTALIYIVISVFFCSLIINMYLSEIIPVIIRSFSDYLYRQSSFKFSFIFSIFCLFIWNYSLYIPDKIFNVFTAGLIFIPNIFDKDSKNRLNDIFKILLIYVGLEILKNFNFNTDFGFNNKIKWLVNNINSNSINIEDILFSIFKGTLYTKFYFLSIRILSECVKLTEKIVELEKDRQ